MQELYRQDTDEVSAIPQTMLDTVSRALVGANDDVVMVTDLLDMDHVEDSAIPVVKSRNFAFAQRITVAEGSNAFIFGISNFSKLTDPEWKQGMLNISRLVVRDTATGMRLFLMDWMPQSPISESEAQSQTINAGNRALDLMVQPGTGAQHTILSRSPLLIIFFGVILTTIGTLYVRSNQAQSYKVALMNRALAQKNFEMNAEAAERERLNDALRKSESDASVRVAPLTL